MNLLKSVAAWWRQRTIRQELLLLATTALLLFFTSLILFAQTTNRLLLLLHRGDRYEQTLSIANNLRRLMNAMDMTVRAYAATGREDFLHSYRIGQQTFRYDVERAFTLLADDPEQSARFEQAVMRADRWIGEFAGRAILLRQHGKRAEVLLASSQAQEVLRLLENDLELFADMERHALLELRAEAEVIVRRMIYLGLLLSIVGILGTLWLTSWVAGNLTQPLAQLLSLMEHLETHTSPEGEELAFTRPPEMVRLAAGFNRLVQTIRKSYQELVTFQTFAEQLHRSRSPEELYQAYLGALGTQFKLEQALFSTSDPASQTVQVAGELIARNNPNAPTVMVHPEACPVIRTSKPFVILETQKQPSCTCELKVAEAGSYYCLPVFGGGTLLGIASLTAAPGYFDNDRRQAALRYTERFADEMYTQQMFTQAQTRAMMDDLTQLYNRRFAEEYLKKQLALSRRTQRSFALLLLDLDHFKDFNDTFGHAAGDRLLLHFATTVVSLLRRSAIVARWGGEEFLVVLPEVHLEGARVVAERLRAAIAQMRLDEPLADLAITTSIGVAVYPQHGSELAELIQAADRALYRAKNEGRNRVELAAEIPTVV